MNSKAVDGPLFDFETPYGYGGPLATSDNAVFLDDAWAEIGEACRAQNIVCGFIRLHPLLDNHRFCAAGAVDVVTDRQTVVLSLNKDKARVWDDYTSSTRGKIRKAQRAGVTVTAEIGDRALSTFGETYQAHMAELGARDEYLFNSTYFQAIGALGDNAHRVYLARHAGQVVGGALVLLSRRLAHYHLSSSLRAHANLAPNNMLRHAAAMDLLDGPWETLHFGGGRTSDPSDSLFKFKAGYSPERATFRFAKFVADRPAYEALCHGWAKANPGLSEKFGSHFLKYRYV